MIYDSKELEKIKSEIEERQSWVTQKIPLPMFKDFPKEEVKREIIYNTVQDYLLGLEGFNNQTLEEIDFKAEVESTAGRYPDFYLNIKHRPF